MQAVATENVSDAVTSPYNSLKGIVRDSFPWLLEECSVENQKAKQTKKYPCTFVSVKVT